MTELQQQVGYLRQRLLVCELDIHRARTLKERVKVFFELSQVMAKIKDLHYGAEASSPDDQLLAGLSNKSAAIRRSESYKKVTWFVTKLPTLCWMIGPIESSIETSLQPC